MEKLAEEMCLGSISHGNFWSRFSIYMLYYIWISDSWVVLIWSFGIWRWSNLCKSVNVCSNQCLSRQAGSQKMSWCWNVSCCNLLKALTITSCIGSKLSALLSDALSSLFMKYSWQVARKQNLFSSWTYLKQPIWALFKCIL